MGLRPACSSGLAVPGMSAASRESARPTRSSHSAWSRCLPVGGPVPVVDTNCFFAASTGGLGQRRERPSRATARSNRGRIWHIVATVTFGSDGASAPSRDAARSTTPLAVSSGPPALSSRAPQQRLQGTRDVSLASAQGRQDDGRSSS